MKYVLFVCTHNAGRSQMAQALFEHYAPDDIRAESAGSDPARQVWPTAVEVMREIGIDISDRKPKRLTVEMQLHADWAVTMGCGDVCPYVPTTVEAWDIPDPADKSIDEVREIRGMIEERVKDLAQTRSTRSAPTPPHTASGSQSSCPNWNLTESPITTGFRTPEGRLVMKGLGVRRLCHWAAARVLPHGGFAANKPVTE